MGISQSLDNPFSTVYPLTDYFIFLIKLEFPLLQLMTITCFPFTMHL